MPVPPLMAVVPHVVHVVVLDASPECVAVGHVAVPARARVLSSSHVAVLMVVSAGVSRTRARLASTPSLP